jgi:hypothetical protein
MATYLLKTSIDSDTSRERLVKAKTQAQALRPRTWSEIRSPARSRTRMTAFASVALVLGDRGAPKG